MPTDASWASGIDELRSTHLGRVDPGGRFSRGWRDAISTVPRDVFVPHFFRPRPDVPGWRLVEPPDDEWCDGVFGNTPLITQLNGDDTVVDRLRSGGSVTGWATSSSSQPSLMVLMLEALDVRPGHHVLEVGTGTGYNAALIAHRIGAERLTSIDVDPVLVETARRRLAVVGHDAVTLVDGDGTKGYPDRAPYDRVIVTVALPALPAELIAQTRSGGRILLPLDTRSGGGAMPLLTVRGDTARGRFLPEFGGFMPLRQRARQDAAATAFRSVDATAVAASATALPVSAVTDDAHLFQFFVSVLTGGIDSMVFTPEDGAPVETWLATPDGSWTCHTTGGATHAVRQGGPVRLWDRVERLHDDWTALGRPGRHRFGLDVAAGRHVLWLDRPDAGHHWTLTRSRYGSD